MEIIGEAEEATNASLLVRFVFSSLLFEKSFRNVNAREFLAAYAAS